MSQQETTNQTLSGLYFDICCSNTPVGVIRSQTGRSEGYTQEKHWKVFRVFFITLTRLIGTDN